MISCEEMYYKINRIKNIVSKTFSYNNMDYRCRENNKNDVFLEGYIDFEPEEWWEIVEHPSSIYILCRNNKCIIDGDIIVPHGTENSFVRLLRTIDNCNTTGIHRYPYTNHVHFDCKVDINRIEKVMDQIIYITKLSEDAIL